MRHPVVCVSAALVTFGIAIMSAVADDRQTCERSRGEEAIAACSRLLDLDPDNVRAYSGRGNAYLAKADYDRAITDLDRAIKLDPKYFFPYYARGSVYLSKGDYDRAIADFDQAILLAPKFPTAYNSRGVAYLGRAAYDRAIEDFNLSIQLNPKNAIAYRNRASAYERKGDFGRARADYDEALRLDQDGAPAGGDRQRVAVVIPGVRYAQPIHIALPDFLASSSAEAGPTRVISQIISANLKRSEKFTPIDQAAFTEKITNFEVPPRFSDWRAIHADTLVTGRVTRQPDGRLKVEFRLWDVQANVQLAGQQYFSTPDNAYRLANIISDAIYERVTGEKGNFDRRTPSLQATENGKTVPDSEKGSTTAEAGGTATAVPQDEITGLVAMLKHQLVSCWNPPVGIAVASTVRVRLELNRDGTLARDPVVLLPAPSGDSGTAQNQLVARSALAAVRACVPLRLPVARYDMWKEVEVTFDPREMLH